MASGAVWGDQGYRDQVAISVLWLMVRKGGTFSWYLVSTRMKCDWEQKKEVLLTLLPSLFWIELILASVYCSLADLPDYPFEGQDRQAPLAWSFYPFGTLVSIWNGHRFPPFRSQLYPSPSGLAKYLPRKRRKFLRLIYLPREPSHLWCHHSWRCGFIC